MTTSLCSCCELPTTSCGRSPELDLASPRISPEMSQSLSALLTGIWVYADDDTLCDVCGEDIESGDKIRPIGSGCYQGSSCCGQEN